jgi:DMSO/TMAO reductase YedYZ molybdopterin-dependent catalytic subunit
MVPESDVVLVVDGAVEHNLKLSFADLAQFPRQSLRATDELGKESLFEGVLVAEILKAAGVKFGKELRGRGSWRSTIQLRPSTSAGGL